MNILLVIPSNTGTIASVSYNLYKGLCKRLNVQVYVACLGHYAKDGYQFTNVFKLGDGHGPISKILSRTLKLKRIKKENNIDISIATLLGAIYWNVLSGCGEKKVGVFHTKLSQQRFRGLMNYCLHYLADKMLVARLDKMIAVNYSAYLDLKQLHRHSNKSIELVYNIHNFDEIEQLATKDIDDETERALFDAGHVILYVGGLYCNVKGTDRLMKAFAKVVQQHKDYKLVFVGGDVDGSLSLLKDMSHHLNIAKSVFFIGKKKNPYQYMKRAEMLVSPSRDEGLPGVLIEALSLGIKCVATNSSLGVWEIMQCFEKYQKNSTKIIETDFGFITPNKMDNEDFTVDKLSEAILKCMKKENFSKILFLKSRFSEAEVVPHYLNIK